MKSIFKLFIALAVVGVLVTSCEKETIQEDPMQAKTLNEGELVLQDTEQVQSRMACSNFEAQVNTALIALAQEIENCAANPTRANKNAIISRYNYYRLQVLEVCLPQAVVVPVLSFDNNPNTNCNFIPGSCSNGSAPLNTLSWFLCHLSNFIENPYDSGNQTDVKNAFNYYVNTLNFCFSNIDLTAVVDDI